MPNTNQEGNRKLEAQLDHLFVLVDSEGVALIPAAAGYEIARHGPHAGGGTGNVVYTFRNALLELAYPLDWNEIAALGEIGFAERWRWRENGYCPFGVVFHAQPPDSEPLPFDTWDYHPPFAPDTRWVIGVAPPQEPLYMLAPEPRAPTPGADIPSLAAVRIDTPAVAPLSPVARALAARRICDIRAAQQPAMEIVVAGPGAQPLDMRSEARLVLHVADNKA